VAHANSINHLQIWHESVGLIIRIYKRIAHRCSICLFINHLQKCRKRKPKIVCRFSINRFNKSVADVAHTRSYKCRIWGYQNGGNEGFFRLEHDYTALYPKQQNFSPAIVVKVKLSLCLTNQALCHEGVWRSGCIDRRFLDLGTNWRWVVSFTPRPLYPGEKVPVIHWIGGWVAPRTGMEFLGKRKL
jgi:hypothetical protein